MNVSRPCLCTLSSRVAATTIVAFGLAVSCFMTTVANAESSASASSGWNLDRLMATLAQSKSGRARFIETKYLAIAAQPVESSGELVFVAPDHLEQRTTRPKPEDLVVDGDKLTVDRNNHKYTLALANYPQLAAFIESIRGTLSGNRYALEQVYKVTVTGHGDDWSMTLVPIESQMLKVVSMITLAGTRDNLQSVTINQADGDHSVMKLQKVSAN
jgi:Outer membrane lipoprotein carrier protein LolA-like